MRLRLTSRSTEKIAAWMKTATDTRRNRMEQVVRSFYDGTWNDTFKNATGVPRWRYERLPEKINTIDLRPGEQIQVIFNILYDPEHADPSADIVSIAVDPAYDISPKYHGEPPGPADP